MDIKVSTVIDKSAEECISRFIDFEELEKWHPYIKKLTLQEGVLLTQDSRYTIDDTNKIITITDILLPRFVTIRSGNNPYTCQHLFRGHDDHTQYNITMTFDGSLFQRLRFIINKQKLSQKLNQILDGFKKYIEES